MECKEKSMEELMKFLSEQETSCRSAIKDFEDKATLNNGAAQMASLIRDFIAGKLYEDSAEESTEESTEE